MAENCDCNVQSPTNRLPKGNSFQGKRGETPDPSTNVQRNMSPGQSPSVNSRPPTLPNNHHQGSQQLHYSNHRPYNQRGRNREGGYYGSQSAYGSHNPGPNRRFSPGTQIPNTIELAAFMNSAWEEFKKVYKVNRGEELHDDVLNCPIPMSQSQTAAPVSPRIPGHVNSPHRGQHSRYTHQNSTGSNWSVNSGGNGRRFSENGDHSNTASLRRHQNNRGGAHSVSSTAANNQPWQRGNFTNRQNSPNNTLNRQGYQRPQIWGSRFTYGPRHHMPSRPVASPTPPPAVSNVPNSPSTLEPTGQNATSVAAVTDMMQSLSVKSHQPSSSESPPSKPSLPNNTNSATKGKKNTATVESPKRGSPSSASSYDIENATPSKVRDETVVSKIVPSSASATSVPPQTSTRRRAATTQGGGTCSAPAVLTLSSFLPVTRQSESASVASSSFCSLIDQGLSSTSW